MGWVALIARVFLAVVFVYAGVTKLLDPTGFAVILSRYHIVPDPMLAPAAYGLPALEALAGIALVFNLKGSLETITALLLLFIGVLWFGILKGLEIDCGCFSARDIAEHGSLRTALQRDLVYLGLAVFLYFRRFKILRSQ